MTGARLRVLATLGLRSLLTHKVSSGIVGSIVFFGTLLVVVGTSLLDTIDRSMAQSITSSIAGHLQLYSAHGRDTLALFGGGFMGTDDIGEIADFAAVREAVEAVPNVRAVVPMGITLSTVPGGNDVDRILQALRDAHAAGKTEQMGPLCAQLRAIVADLVPAWERRLSISRDQEKLRAELDDLRRMDTPDFWNGFDKHAAQNLDYLDAHLAPLAESTRLLYLRNMGTDLDRFTTLFDRFTIADGQMVPSGKRGFLFSKRVYEKFIKNKVARELDDLHTATVDKHERIAASPTLADRARRLPQQYDRITFQLAPAAAQRLQEQLQTFLRSEAKGLTDLVKSFLAVDDGTLAERYAFFYENIAPHIELYTVRVGDTITLRGLTKSGYLKSQNVKVYGTFQFKGLEKSDLAGAENLVDLQTFRELYGQMTPERLAELETLRREVGVGEVARDEAEAALFGAPVQALGNRAEAGFDEFAEADLRAAHRAVQADDHLDAAALQKGLALNAAVLLDDPAAIETTRSHIEAALAARHLPIKVLDWQAASGLVGQFIVMVRVVLYVAIFIIFLVALVIINNAMVMATMERVTEIGTMRAIGAQRSFVLVAFLLETLLLCLVAGSLGAAAGAGVVEYLGQVGIPASTDIMVFLFSGPRLYPTVGLANVVGGMAVIVVVSLISTLYPARIATGIAPVVAMQAKE